VTDLDLKKLVGAALMVPPTDNWHYPLSENQLRHLITQAVEAEREAICELVMRRTLDALPLIDAIRARGESK
jgi:hypothetical protein